MGTPPVTIVIAGGIHPPNPQPLRCVIEPGVFHPDRDSAIRQKGTQSMQCLQVSHGKPAWSSPGAGIASRAAPACKSHRGSSCQGMSRISFARITDLHSSMDFFSVAIFPSINRGRAANLCLKDASMLAKNGSICKTPLTLTAAASIGVFGRLLPRYCSAMRRASMVQILPPQPLSLARISCGELGVVMITAPSFSVPGNVNTSSGFHQQRSHNQDCICWNVCCSVGH